MERTFIMIKPDGVQRGLVGECIKRFENVGLKIIAMKMLKPSKELIERHYPSSTEWFKIVGERTKKTFEDQGIDLNKKFGSTDSITIGKIIKSWLVKFITSGSVVVAVLEGNRAIDNVRRLCGETDPIKAAPGTIRGDFSTDSIVMGNKLSRPVMNVIHASGNPDEAKNEINLWFKPEELTNYQRYGESEFYKEW